MTMRPAAKKAAAQTCAHRGAIDYHLPVSTATVWRLEDWAVAGQEAWLYVCIYTEAAQERPSSHRCKEV